LKEETFIKLLKNAFIFFDDNDNIEELKNKVKEAKQLIKERNIFLIPKKIKPFNKEYKEFLIKTIEELRKIYPKVFLVNLPPCLIPGKFDSYNYQINNYFVFLSEEGLRKINFNRESCIFRTKGLCDGIFCSNWKIEKEKIKEEKVNINGKNYFIVYSPDKIGFAVFDEKEYEEFKDLIENYNKEYNFYYYFLWRRGLIKINNVSIIDFDFIEKMKEINPSIVEIELSNACNLRCTYCYVAAGKDKVIDWQLLKKIIEKTIKEFAKEKDEIAIQLGGGEALLFMDLIEKAVHYGKHLASKENKKVRFMIQSNGLLLGKYAEKLKELGISVGVSFDGPYQDINRPLPNGKGSRELFLKSINEARKKGLIVDGAISVVINPKQMPEIYEDLKNNGFRRIKFLYYFKAGRGKEKNIEEMNKEEQLLFANYEFELFKKGIKEGIFLTETITKVFNLINRERPEVCSKTPCGAGRNFFVFDREGNIYPCYHFIKIPKFKMGTINDSFDKIINSKIKKELDERQVENLECKNCPIKYFCCSGCTSHAYFHYGKIKAKSPYCLYYKEIYKKLMIWLKENYLIF
jgi:uncharacterized protein